MASEDIPKTAIITPFGLLEFLKMPFGLKCTGQTFQRLMDEVCASLPFTFVYIDDVLIASPDFKTHLHHLHLVLQLFQQNCLVINPAKCEFCRSEVSFLGHHQCFGSALKKCGSGSGSRPSKKSGSGSRYSKIRPKFVEKKCFILKNCFISFFTTEN